MNTATIKLIELSTQVSNYLAPTNTVNLFGNKILREINLLITHKCNTDIYKGAKANIIDSLNEMVKVARTNPCQNQPLVPIAEKLLNEYKQEHGFFEVGMEVKLKKNVSHTCPKGRTNNKTARISVFMEDYSEGAIRMDRDLKGCVYWNIEDLEICSFEETTY